MKTPRPARPRSRSVGTRQLLLDIVDHLAPRLDTYELAIYLYLLRHTRLAGKIELKTSLGTARLGMAGGRPRKGMSRKTCLDRVRTLEAKGLIRARTSRKGTRVRLFLPREVRDVVVCQKPSTQQVPPRSPDF
jgi:hypothetical protein